MCYLNTTTPDTTSISTDSANLLNAKVPPSENVKFVGISTTSPKSPPPDESLV